MTFLSICPCCCRWSALRAVGSTYMRKIASTSCCADDTVPRCSSTQHARNSSSGHSIFALRKHVQRAYQHTDPRATLTL
jgi:hypothetical protein